ncbi:MAG: extracellular solute-binding protein [Treponema sp.]|nr:extracellular solute-binding protein [Treponema sp.]
MKARFMGIPLCALLLVPGLVFAGAKQDVQKRQAKAVKLEYFSLKPEVVGVMDTIIARFNRENPGIEVTQTSVADSGTVLLTRISTNAMPDLLQSFPAEDKYKVMFDDGLMTELTDQPFMKNVQQAMLDMAAYRGKQYALPMTLSSYGIYYRTDIFEKYGIKEPATYDELIGACKTLQAAGIDAFALPNKDVGNTAQRLERLIGVLNNNSNEEFKKIKSGAMKVEDSVTIRRFAQMCVEIARYGTRDSLGLDYESAVADLVNGKAAMMISGTWMLSTMQQSDPNIKIKLMPFPSPLGAKPMVPVNIDTSFSLAADCEYQAEGLKFIEFLSRTDIAQIYYEVDGNVNMIKGVVYDKQPHMTMKGLMDKGDMFLTQVNFWPTGLREEMRPASQQIFMDGSVDNFVAAFGEAIRKKYP